MRHSHGCIERGKQSKGSEDFVVGISTGVNDRRTKTIKGQRDKAARIAKEPPRYPPQRAPQQDSGEQETAMQQQQYVAELVAHLPGGRVLALAGHYALQGQGQPGNAVSQRAILDVAAGGEVARQGIWFFPHLASAAGEVVIPRGEGLAMKYPETLRHQQQ